MGIFNKIISFFSVIFLTIQAAIPLPVLSINFKFDVEASVFESGDEMYTVIWTTTRPGTGYVTYTYGDREYTVYDQDGGNIRTLDTIHAVRVPKAHIDNNEFVYHSQFIRAKLAYDALKGKTISSEPVNFRGYNGESAVNALVLSDIHGDPNPVEKAVSYFDTEPDILILAGDIVSQMVNQQDFLDILDYAHMFSKGEIPVVYARGNHEPRGEYSPEMLKYFRTSTSGFYFTFTYGPIWSVVLDGGEDKEDGHKEYSGLVDFRTYVAEETKWLSGVKPADTQYRIAVVHKPNMDDLDGSQWLGMLSDIGIDASISGHFHRLELHFFDGSVPYHRLITGGKDDDNGGYIATMLTFADGRIKAVSYNDSGTVMADEYLDINRKAA